MALDFIKRLIQRQDKQQREIETIDRRVATSEEDIREIRAKVQELESRLAASERTLEAFDSKLRREMERLQKDSAGLKALTKKKLRELEEEHGALIKVLQMSIAKQVMPEREQKLSKLLKTARQRRTLIEREVQRRALQ